MSDWVSIENMIAAAIGFAVVWIGMSVSHRIKKRRLLRALANLQAAADLRYCKNCGLRIRGIATAPEIPVHFDGGYRKCFPSMFRPQTLAEWRPEDKPCN